MKAKNIYSVSVGNVGTIGYYTNKKNAIKVFQTCVEQSLSDIGRAGGEDVTLWKNGEPIKEYIGSLSLLADRK